MGLTERHWLENEDVPENYEWALEDAVWLKEQKPIYSEEMFSDHLPHCPVCKRVLPSVSQYGKSNFCHNCGQTIKWKHDS